MENVFGGLRITTEQDPPHRADLDLRPRPWLSNVKMSAVQVSITPEDDDKPEK
jgi:hypothetical protein